MANMTITEILTGIRDWVNGFHIESKATKVGNATNGNFAALNGSGDLTDSGKKASDFAQAGDMTTVQGKVATIEGKIPSAASSSNQLADKAYLVSQIAGFITRSVNDLANYYLKTETYTKTEVQALISAVKQFTYQVVAELPTASASTMNIIYLVPSADPQQQNVKDEFITIQNGSTYSWEQIGSTAIDLSGYYTSQQTDAAITAALNTALANYYTSTQVDAAITTALGSYYTKTQADTLLAEKEAVVNKVTSLSSESTDTEYPSAKVVYDAMQSENADIQALAKLLVQQQYEIEGLKKMVEGNLGDIRATTINTDDMPMVSGKPLVIVENGAPTEVPYFVGQIHVNRSTSPSTIKVCYQVTGSISDWK